MGLFAAILSIGWINQHRKEFFIGVGVVIGLLIYAFYVRHKRIKAYQAQQLEIQQREEPKRQELEPAAEPEPSVSFPDEIDGKTIAYHYPDVKLIPPTVASPARVGQSVTLRDTGDTVQVHCGVLHLGDMPKSRLSDMVRDWNAAGDPVVAYVSKVSGNEIEIAIAFYRDATIRFLSKHPDAKLVKLNGKPDEIAFYSKGMECEIEEDFDSEKYLVLCDGLEIGKLPASAVAYAKNHEIDPADLSVVIAEIDYDDDRDRDVISVYIAD